MAEFLFRRVINNKWLFICLLSGVVFACGVFASLPMYSSAILQKVLTKDLENHHVKSGISPGMFTVTLGEFSGNDPNIVAKVGDIAENQLSVAYGLPIEKKLSQVNSTNFKLLREGDEIFNKKNIYPVLTSITDYQNNIKILNGRIPKSEPENGVYEVAVSSEALGRLQLLMDNVYSIAKMSNTDKEYVELAKIKVVCVFSVENRNDFFWSGGRFDNLNNSLVMDSDALANLSEKFEEVKINSVKNVYFLDYRAIKIDDVEKMGRIYEGQLRWRARNGNIADINFPALEVLENYEQRGKELKITLWILTIPLMIIICFYTLMISTLIVKNDKNEIALLKSRGASRIQIFILYVLESSVISLVSFAVGPFLGYFICKLLGSSNGFLEFVSRKALPVVINSEAFLFSFIAAAVFLIFMLIPAIKASTKSIVQYKRSITEDNEKPLWKKLYLDVLVLGFSVYGLYSFNNRQEILRLTGLKGSELGVDPLLFFISTFFIVGVSLVFLRIYPHLMRLIFIMGIKWWNPVLYFSLVNVSRSDKNQQSIMLFLILALSFGIINSNQARTINNNMIDRIMYTNGADVVIEPYNNLKHIRLSTMGAGMAKSSTTSTESYNEPPYEEYKKIEGIESMTKVFVNDSSTLKSGVANIRDIRLMGIIPHEFAKTSWFRKDLLPHHINEYMNLLAKAPKAALLSTDFRDKYKLKKGDKIYFQWGSYDFIECTVYEFIDYFPSCNPYLGGENGERKPFAVINYSYILKKLPKQPYEIWIKKDRDIPDGMINDQLNEKNLSVERVDYSMQEIIANKNDPVLLGTNGVFTMCFLVTMFIAAVGFIVFWVLSIKDRALKFGIFRAMGMSMGSVSLIMICEQILVSGVAIASGITIGTAASKVFIPLLQVVHSSSQQVPPFTVVALRSDYLRVMGVTFAMLVTAIAFLYWLVRKINIHQVLKLGED